MSIEAKTSNIGHELYNINVDSVIITCLDEKIMLDKKTESYHSFFFKMDDVK